MSQHFYLYKFRCAKLEYIRVRLRELKNLISIVETIFNKVLWEKIMEEILDLLRQNARLSNADIAAMTKKTEAEVEAVIKKLEDDGVILKYAAVINPEKDKVAQEKVVAEIQIQVQPQRGHGFDAIADRIYRFPQVKSLYLMSGGYDLRVLIEGDNLKEIAMFVSEKLSTLEGVRSTKTNFVLKTYKENDIIYVADEADRREMHA